MTLPVSQEAREAADDDVCVCGDYRRQHKYGRGRCVFNDYNGGHGMGLRACNSFRPAVSLKEKP